MGVGRPAARVTRLTYHLVPEAVWDATEPDVPYAAASLTSEGFIHCTDGAAELVATANRHYLGDARGFLALTIDLDRSGSPWRIEDQRGIYPHVFGPIDRAAIVRYEPMERDIDGRFLGVGEQRIGAE